MNSESSFVFRIKSVRGVRRCQQCRWKFVSGDIDNIRLCHRCKKDTREVSRYTRVALEEGK